MQGADSMQTMLKLMQMLQDPNCAQMLDVMQQQLQPKPQNSLDPGGNRTHTGRNHPTGSQLKGCADGGGNRSDDPKAANAKGGDNTSRKRATSEMTIAALPKCPKKKRASSVFLKKSEQRTKRGPFEKCSKRGPFEKCSKWGPFEDAR